MNVADVKKLTIPEGEVVRILSGDTVLWQKHTTPYTNLLPLATDTDRTTVYNGCGFLPGYRISSSGAVTVHGGEMCATGFIPAKAGDVLRVQGFDYVSGTSYYVIAYDASNTKTGYKVLNAYPGCYQSTWVSPGYFEITLDAATFGSGFNAVRVTVRNLTADSIITVNEPIV